MRRSLLLTTLLFLCCCITAWAQDKKAVAGTVKDAKGTPLPGVTVKEKNASNGATTGPDGNFKIQVADGATLVFSYIGFINQEVAVNGQSAVNIVLKEDNKNLNEVVVTAMGIKREAKALGYSVSTVSSKEITESGSTNFASALYGKAAGVKIVAAPGGAASGVSVQVRGVSSVSLSTQPLYVVDGVPLRNFNDPTTNTFGTSNSRIEGNGALDINPEDIETLTILKGASASALYGSEATNGVVVITTKKGAKGRGLNVDVNYVYNQEKLAATPDYQNEYGPGYDPATNLQVGATPDGWITDADGAMHPYYRAYDQFGPKFDGRDVKYWDGTTRKYVAQKDNYKDFFQNGYNSAANVAISNASDKGSFRFSYNRVDYKSIMPGSNLYKNNFNFNGTLKLSDRVSVDLISTYNNTFVHNRANVMSNIFGSFDGFFSRFDDMSTFFNKYQTSNGYKYVAADNNQYDQDEKMAYRFRATNLMDYLWNNLRNRYDETQNRFINSATLNVSILNSLRFRGRVGGDFTNVTTSDQQYNTKPAVYGYTGQYALNTRNNNSFYGDAMLIYNPKVAKDFDMSFTGGVTGRKQKYKNQYTQTKGGLMDENWFSLANSADPLYATGVRAEQIDVAGFGMVNLAYKGFLFLEGTGRYESTSTLPVKNNKYFYPSVNAGFLLSEVVKLPSFVDYAKFRASYGLVGNHPNMYQANVAYNPYTVTLSKNNIPYQQTNPSAFGNEELRSEKKRETEFGFEARFLKNKLGVDFSYYNNKVMDQILTMSTPASGGATSQIMNAGDLSNSGFEAAINASPITTKNFSWTTRFNFAINKNKLTALRDGMTTLTMQSYDGGYLLLQSNVGDPLGNIYVHPRDKDANGNYLVNADGIYTANTNAWELAGNIMPKVVGGFSNSLRYKNFTLDFTLDYRLGGDLVSIPYYYQIGAGMFNSTLQYRDAAHGGIAYDAIDYASGNLVANPNGAHHDGVILPGVTADGKKNEKVITAAQYYMNQYDWQTNGLYENAVMKNSYIKLREVTLTYNMPKSIVEKLHFQGLQFSLVGRNLFYVWKTLPKGLDPEVAVGSQWFSQGIDGGTVGPTRSLGASLRARF
ncbi:iron complex outermembrane recepter protein [Chitinophaga ginsengisegetis]|uniref:Iron complex outermembrane recepter protein n=1 Tax=Chitinophaga ginsengisegetis TaxID=393003 RepID=A0A1T5NZM8_9BACT|nr:SusC/RagA family TonB-linked outer membrane protein [Chitinophaga ginsengisegetis]MDR6567038.1 iron complex outermembrane receptor protein [Chitinophaga ginsengisegetis]MDR6646768.1 iron complex outermembrane receptor protein [Chitinophaga ginsengisegetis]MDR6653118.1 iron complex outermembrane receptor protein [Chitinophaga ginsengisegetis]SKD05882.1 iron complex outermembrane recepter protein [Chitinophaga ginsengisegetis]